MATFEGKPCKKCGATERRTTGRCVPCQRAYYTARRLANPEKFRIYERALQARDLEKRRLRMQAYRAAHLEECRATVRAYGAAHLEEHRAAARAYHAANHGRIAADKRDKRAAKRTASFLSDLTAIFLDISKGLQND